MRIADYYLKNVSIRQECKCGDVIDGVAVASRWILSRIETLSLKSFINIA